MHIDKLPPFFEAMKRDVANLCKAFAFVRGDFFLANNTCYFSELTFTPIAGMMPFNPDKYDLEWGKELDIPNRGMICEIIFLIYVTITLNLSWGLIMIYQFENVPGKGLG